jgi:hypothetical protein
LDKPTLFLHAGLHKTGTTFLQGIFAGNREKLAQEDVLYPQSASGKERAAHHDLGRALEVDCPDDEPVLRWLRDIDRSESGTILLSSETLCKLTAPQLRRIRDAVTGHTVKPVLFFREWSGALASRWQQTLRRRPEPLPAYLAGYLLEALEVPFINYALTLDIFAEAFGRENVIAVSYDNAMREPGGILEFFARQVLTISQPTSELSTELVHANIKSTPESAALLRVLHFALGAERGDRAPWILSRKHGPSFFEAVPELATLSRYKQTLTIPATGRLFRQLNEDIFAAYGDRFLNPSSSGIFAEIGGTPLVHIPLERWMADNPDAVRKVKAHADTQLRPGLVRPFRHHEA